MWSTKMALTRSAPMLNIRAHRIAVPQGGYIYVHGIATNFLGNLEDSSSTSEYGARNVLLLHGDRFSARTWQDLGTLSLLADAGYRVAAVNLHSYLE